MVSISIYVINADNVRERVDIKTKIIRMMNSNTDIKQMQHLDRITLKNQKHIKNKTTTNYMND